MAKKTGTCMNLDCDNYKKEVEIEPGEEFECPVCHQPLREGKGRSSNNKDGGQGKKKIMIIVGALVIVAAAAAGIVLSMGGDKSKTPVNEQPKIDLSIIDSAKVDTPAIKAEPVVEEPKVVEPKEEPVKPKTSIQTGKGTVDLGYGSYTGDLKNGKPHGYGTITYKTSRKIVSSKDYVANPGDTFEGEFREGKISGLGYWKHDGNQTAVKP